ncbi:hypothetical protein GCM10020331_048360 [Ectobacillus funiculus]
MSNEVTEVVEQLARPIVEDMDLELVDVEYVKEGKDWFFCASLSTLKQEWILRIAVR